MTEPDSHPIPQHDDNAAAVQAVRHGLCEHCGYHFEGTPVIEGELRCPECGRLSDLSLEPPEHRGDRGLGCLLIAAFAIVIPLVVIGLMAPTEWRLVGGLAGAVVLLAVLPRTLRRVFDV
jgi:hypothetical protein